MEKKRLAILIGNGSRLLPIYEYCKEHSDRIEIAIVVSYKRRSSKISWIKKHGIPSFYHRWTDYKLRGKTREEFNYDLMVLLKKYKTNVVLGVGWNIIWTSSFLQAFPNRVLNAHPFPLPNGSAKTIIYNKQTLPVLRGMNALHRAYDLKLPITGACVHFAQEAIDTGYVLFRDILPIKKGETFEELEKRHCKFEGKVLKRSLKLLTNNIVDKHVFLNNQRGLRVLVTGSGGREHATVYAFLKCKNIAEIYVSPGNDGMFYGNSKDSRLKRVNITVNNQQDINKLITFSHKKAIDLVYVGPEKHLSLGIVDSFEKNGISIVGPSQKASILESSKAWTKDVMSNLSIPIPEYAHFDNPEKAKEYIKSRSYPVVVKADGLAAGKGSIVTNTEQEALDAVDLIMRQQKFGSAGNRVVIEKRLDGDEFSFFAFTDGKTIKHMAWARDYKAVFDGDKGLNTGGIGGFSPYKENKEKFTNKVMTEIALPLIKGCRQKYNFTYKGILYIGGTFLKENGETNPYVFEINVRMGDPEAQVIYPRLKTGLYKISMAIVNGTLNKVDLKWDNNYYVCVCATSGRIRGKKGWYRGYPGRYAIGKKITGLDKISKHILVFHSGTKWDKEKKCFITAGGRVLSVVASGKSLKEARKRAYIEIEKIHFAGMHYRKDIGEE